MIDATGADLDLGPDRCFPDRSRCLRVLQATEHSRLPGGATRRLVHRGALHISAGDHAKTHRTSHDNEPGSQDNESGSQHDAPGQNAAPDRRSNGSALPARDASPVSRPLHVPLDVLGSIPARAVRRVGVTDLAPADVSRETAAVCRRGHRHTANVPTVTVVRSKVCLLKL